MKFANALGIPLNFVFPGDYGFWEMLNEVVQEEPAAGSDPTTHGLFASIGIQKGSPLEPWFDQSWRPGEIELVQ